MHDRDSHGPLKTLTSSPALTLPNRFHPATSQIR